MLRLHYAMLAAIDMPRYAMPCAPMLHTPLRYYADVAIYAIFDFRRHFDTPLPTITLADASPLFLRCLLLLRAIFCCRFQLCYAQRADYAMAPLPLRYCCLLLR